MTDLHCHPAEGCITCGDRADAVRVLRVDEDRGLALCEGEGGDHLTIETALVEPVAVGDELLVHAGTAIGRPSREAWPFEAGRMPATISERGAGRPAEVTP